MYNIFDDVAKNQKEQNMQKTIIDIKNKFGKNSILKGISYTEKGTARKRNTLVGGHNGEWKSKAVYAI